MRYDVLLLGDYFFDQIYSGLPHFPILGQEVWAHKLTTVAGAMYTTAAACTRLGMTCAWVSNFGSDYYSRFVYQVAQAEGIDLQFSRVLDDPYQRVTTALPLGSERAFITYEDPSPADANAYWLRCAEQIDYRHLHLGGFPEGDMLPRLSAYAHARGATLSMDSQDGAHLADPAQCRAMLQHIDMFMPNAREARIITETTEIERALECLMALVGVAVIKDGEHGAWAGRGGEIHFAPSIQAGTVIDTTGAGDCFNAGFLLGHIVEAAPLHTSLRYGNICGGLSVTAVGGATAAPSRAVLGEWLRRDGASSPKN